MIIAVLFLRPPGQEIDELPGLVVAGATRLLRIVSFVVNIVCTSRSTDGALMVPACLFPPQGDPRVMPIVLWDPCQT
jgi:hypothetical protein